MEIGIYTSNKTRKVVMEKEIHIVHETILSNFPWINFSNYTFTQIIEENRKTLPNQILIK
jgi:hypothetical protein